MLLPALASPHSPHLCLSAGLSTRLELAECRLIKLGQVARHQLGVLFELCAEAFAEAFKIAATLSRLRRLACWLQA